METGMVLWVNPHHLHHHQVNFKKAYGYAQAMERGDTFPPVKVYVDGQGKLLVADGAHRTAASKMVDQEVLIEVVGKASDEEDYSTHFKYKPRAKDFWHKRAKKRL